MVKRLNKTALLYHWAPSSIRADIHRDGLLVRQLNVFRIPAENPDGSFWVAPWVCLGMSPVEAWAWGGLKPGLEYDLWVVLPDADDKVVCRRDGGTDIIEVRIHNDIDKNRLWLAGSRRA